jgi:hypothetical protein
VTRVNPVVVGKSSGLAAGCAVSTDGGAIAWSAIPVVRPPSHHGAGFATTARAGIAA